MTMILGGVIFWLPLVIITMVLGKAFQLMKFIAEPLDALIPLDSIGGFALVNVIAALAIILSCFLAGLAAQSSRGRSISGSVDEKLQVLIPGYSLLRDKMTGAISYQEHQVASKPVLVQFDDYSQIAIEIERAPDGLVAIFLPGAPDPWSGSVVFVTPDRVAPIDTEMKAAVKTLRMMGHGSTAAIGKVRIELPATPA
jgi:uncharacterized membrane protein